MAGNNTMTVNEAARYTVTVAGQEITGAEPGGLEYLALEEHVDMIGVAELTFAAGQGVEWSSFEIGADIDVKVGGSTRKSFVGHITGLRRSYAKGADTVTVLAMDPLCKLAASRKVYVYEEMTDSDIVSQVLGDYGVAGVVDSTSGSNDYVLQRNESDMHFLRRLAARNGFLLMANEGKIDFVKMQGPSSTVDIEKGMLISLDFTTTTRNIPTKLTTYGWDYVAKEMVEGSAEPTLEVGQIWAGESYVSDVLVSSQSAAQAMSDGEMNRLSYGYLRGRAVLQGNGDLHVGKGVSFTGHQVGFNPQQAFIISARHRVSAQMGFQTEILFIGNQAPT